jgi:hypothetical protein
LRRNATTLYDVHDVRRFGRVQEFASYSRLVKCQQSSAGKVKGTGGEKVGNAYLKWAFSEAAVLFLTKCAPGRKLFTRMERLVSRIAVQGLFRGTSCRGLHDVDNPFRDAPEQSSGPHLHDPERFSLSIGVKDPKGR